MPYLSGQQQKMGDILDSERLALVKDMKSGDVRLQVAESLKKYMPFRRSFKIGKVIFLSSDAAQRLEGSLVGAGQAAGRGAEAGLGMA